MARAALVLFVLVASAAGLELDWIPAGDGPLPLSAAYRERLSRLCDVVERGGPLPPSIEARLSDITRMCAKLRRSQQHGGALSKVKLGLASLIGLGGGVWAVNSYRNRGWVYTVIEDQRRQAAKSRYRSRGSAHFPKLSPYATVGWLADRPHF
mmetsp:Transcript_3523/g.10880  ORF Transcript_3523/g.10880 Transcript_3523/m.10880 type:complete len:153 (+) Transcript_3523:10-468(+)